jgi:hypothetical protein
VTYNPVETRSRNPPPDPLLVEAGATRERKPDLRRRQLALELDEEGVTRRVADVLAGIRLCVEPAHLAGAQRDVATLRAMRDPAVEAGQRHHHALP